MVRRSADKRRVIPREIQSLFGARYERRDIFFDRFCPARAALFSQLAFEQTISFEPHINVPVAVEARLKNSLLILSGQQITDANGERQHFGITEASIARMVFGV